MTNPAQSNGGYGLYVKWLPPAGPNGERWKVARPDGTTLDETVAVCDTAALAHEVMAALALVEACNDIVRRTRP